MNPKCCCRNRQGPSQFGGLPGDRRIAKAVTKVPGIGRVAAITRPEETVEVQHDSAQISMRRHLQEMNRLYGRSNHGQHAEPQANDMHRTTIDTMTKMSPLMGQMMPGHAFHGPARTAT